MPRHNDTNSKVFYKGGNEDFIVFVDDHEILQKWRNDRSIPLSDVVNGFKIFVTHRHGTQGILDTASKALLENEFGTSDEDDCLLKILEKGDFQLTPAREQKGDKNTSQNSGGHR